MPKWIFRLADSTTMRNLSGVSPISPMWSPSLNLIYNEPGTFSAEMPIDSDAALAIEKHRTCVVAERDGRPEWSGPITGIVDDASSNPADKDTTKITATGWFEELNRRYIQPVDEQGLIFNSGTDLSSSIIFALLSICAARDDSSGTSAPMRITAGTATDTVTRRRSYKRGQSFGAAIKELVDIENGVDIFIDPLTRKINVRDWDQYFDHKDVHFTLGMGADNVLKVNRQEDAATNSITATGAGALRIIVDDPAEIQRLGVMLEEEISADISNLNILGAYANAELTFKLHGSQTLSVLPATISSDSTANVYRLFDDFQLGDMVYLSVDKGRMRFRRHPMRAFGTTITVDNEGNEILSEIQVTVQ